MRIPMPWLSLAQPPKPTATTPADRQKIYNASVADSEALADAQARDAEALAREKALAADLAANTAAARQRCVVIETRMLTRSLAYGVRDAARKAELCAGAPEIVDRFLSDMTAELDATRRLVEILGSTDLERDEISGALRPARIATNSASVGRRLTAISAAMARAEALKLEVDVNEDTIKATLRELLVGLPAVEGAVREVGSIHSPAELRAAKWRREGSTR